MPISPIARNLFIVRRASLARAQPLYGKPLYQLRFLGYTTSGLTRPFCTQERAAHLKMYRAIANPWEEPQPEKAAAVKK
jgi:hypothetical protein